MPIQRIAHSSTEIDVENYIGILRAGQSISDTGWSIYADSAGVNPIDGLGGSPSITWSQNSISPLSGEVDLRLVKDANNRQGNGVSIPFTVANRHLGKVLQISFDTELISGNYESPIITPTNGTYTITSTTVCTVTASHSFVAGQIVNMTFIGGTRPVDGFYTIVSVTATAFVITVSSGSATNATCSYTVPADLRVSIIQDPTGTPVVIEPVNTGIQLGIANQRIRHIASFQTHISITSYRLCVHVSNASTVAYTVDFANFKVWETTQSIGSIITDWISYTPSTTRANTTNRSFYYRRVGGGIQISFGWQYTAGVTGSSTALLTDIFPPGLTLDLNRIAAANGSGSYLRYNIGYYFVNDFGINNYTGTIVWDTNQNPDQLAFMGVAPNGADDNISVFIECPIAGWGSSVAMSSDSGDGRVVALLYRGSLNTGASPSVNFTWSSTTREYDTHSAYNPSTGVFTAPMFGYYRFSGLFNTDLSNEGIIPYVNSISLVYYAGNSYNALHQLNGTVRLNAGDILTFRTLTRTVGSVGSGNFISIERISAGSQVIATQETVACRYEKTDGANVLSSATDMIYNVRTKDTHSAYNTTNGEYTVPISGYYQINCIVGLSNGSLYNIHVLKNGSVTDLTTVGGVTTMNRRNLSTGNYYLAGDKIKIQALADTTRSTDTQAGANTLFICRLGI